MSEQHQRRKWAGPSHGHDPAVDRLAACPSGPPSRLRGSAAPSIVVFGVDGPSNPFSVDAIRGQEIQLRSYAKENGIEVTGIYLDVGFSGRKLDRPGLCSVLRAVKDGQADTVLVVNHNRLFRGQYPKELKGLPVIALQEQIQTKKRGGFTHEK